MNTRTWFTNMFTLLSNWRKPVRSDPMRQVAFPPGTFWRMAEERDQISQAVSVADQCGTEHSNVLFSNRIDWVSLKIICEKWIKNPMNMALLIWIICVAVSGALLFLVMTGMLNHVLPKKSQRNAWFEINNQILNALFTLMCLYQHPRRFYHLALLIRWNHEDVLKLRKEYCKDAKYKPHEWTHMMVVVLLLHVNCFAQYALCGLNLAYKRSERPALGVAICISFAISSPAIAGLYAIVSSLGKDYTSELDWEVHEQRVVDTPRLKSFEKKYSFVLKDDQTVETQPRWAGGLLDLWDDISVAYLSLFCGFCVFGWNMDRLGFGNMYVHIATFLLFCTAPFWIFNLAAVNVDNEDIREALSLVGLLLCVFGLLYGGYWRIRMRDRFNLPKSNFCCGHPSVADCAQWLCCCICSLAQEVRTADAYGIEEGRLPHALNVMNSSSSVKVLERKPSSQVSGSDSCSSNSCQFEDDNVLSSTTPRLIRVEEICSVTDGTTKYEHEVVRKPPAPSSMQKNVFS